MAGLPPPPGLPPCSWTCTLESLHIRSTMPSAMNHRTSFIFKSTYYVSFWDQISKKGANQRTETNRSAQNLGLERQDSHYTSVKANKELTRATQSTIRTLPPLALRILVSNQRNSLVRSNFNNVNAMDRINYRLLELANLTTNGRPPTSTLTLFVAGIAPRA